MGLLAGAILIALGALVDWCTDSDPTPPRDPTPALEEVRFRVRQVDDVMAQATASLDRSHTSADQALLALFRDAPLLTVAAKLGGIYSAPLSSGATVWIGGSGYGERHLPSQRGFKDSTFGESSLKDVWREYHRIICDAEPAQVQLATMSDLLRTLEEAATPTPAVSTASSSGTNGYELQQWRDRTRSADVEATVAELRSWIRSFERAWSDLKTSELLVSLADQLTDRRAYESNCSRTGWLAGLLRVLR